MKKAGTMPAFLLSGACFQTQNTSTSPSCSLYLHTQNKESENSMLNLYSQSLDTHRGILISKD